MKDKYSHPVYKGLFYVYEIGEFMRWPEHQEFYKGYNAYCSRMWLDYCDENNTILSEHLTKNQYVNKYAKWLAQRYISGAGFA